MNSFERKFEQNSSKESIKALKMKYEEIEDDL